jgi:hypothetical protein
VFGRCASTESWWVDLPTLLPDRRRLPADVTTGDARRPALDGEIGWAKAFLVLPEQYEARPGGTGAAAA